VTTTPGTVGQLLSAVHGSSWAEDLTALSSGPLFARLTKALVAQGNLMSSAGVFKTAAARIPDLLRLDVGVILVGGWQKIAELQRYADRGKYGPDKTVIVELTRHTVTSSHKPSLDIVFDGAKVDTVPFELKFTVTLDGALLTICDGQILAVSPGACSVGGELKCEGYSILKRESAQVKVPGTWTFKEPFLIAPSAHAARPAET
jgi:hypothetical protein